MQARFLRNERGPWFSSDEIYFNNPCEPEKGNKKEVEREEEKGHKSSEKREHRKVGEKRKEETLKKSKSTAITSPQSQPRVTSRSVHNYATHHASHVNTTTTTQSNRSYAQLHRGNVRKDKVKTEKNNQEKKRENNNNNGYAQRYQRVLSARSQLASLPVNVTPSKRDASKNTKQRAAKNETNEHEQEESPLHTSSEHDRQQTVVLSHNSTENVNTSLKSIVESAKWENTSNEEEILHSSSATEDEVTHKGIVEDEQHNVEEHKTVNSKLKEESRNEETAQKTTIKKEEKHNNNDKEEKTELLENASVQEVINDNISSIIRERREEIEPTTHASERNEITLQHRNFTELETTSEEQEETFPRVMLPPLQSSSSTRSERFARYEQPTVASLMHAE